MQGRRKGSGSRKEKEKGGKGGEKEGKEKSLGRGDKMGKEKRKKEQGEREETGNYGAGDLTIYIKA